ncbi:hypothetical protein SK571_25250 [Lentzea sp. BCCO 10_0798]|jgi:hypothetical protein|uniref:Polysaccharide lyase family 7 protein n=1 Tax=Lentzea kristufekii TaxID=3095430 RepID=A0ABU4TWL9_9PSEU|nr:hypothetical protein [Lentzea sp. BCCO 10_0798]MDX8052705.1 hypothetical protein [Lentzea sp. BCCO 10_0798]
MRLIAIAGVTVLMVAGLQPVAHAGPVGSGWTEHSPAWNLQIQSKGVITSYPSSTTSASGPGGSYTRSGGVQTFKLVNNGSNRVEARIQDNYRTGQRQFEGELKVTAGTDDESAMQIFGNDGDGATTLMIRSFSRGGGTLRGGGKDLVSGINGKWVRINVTHNATATGGSYSIHINGKHVHTANGPKGDHYFKYGVYGTLKTAGAEHQWRNVHFYRK